MQKLFRLLAKAAASDATVLLEGETGTGKDLTAQSLHDASERRDGPFMVVDCGAIPGPLLESELFGYQRGAFTGAVTARAGAFESANGGTIFLDEIGELDLDVQPKLLRVLESRTVKRVGANHYAPIDVRVIAATNRSLRDEVKAGRFRSDLYYRLAVVHVPVPPLRERREDLHLLADAILRQLGLSEGQRQEFMAAPQFRRQLEQGEWPGNVRQLRNFLEQRVTLGASLLPPGNDSLFPSAGPTTTATPPRKLSFDMGALGPELGLPRAGHGSRRRSSPPRRSSIPPAPDMPEGVAEAKSLVQLDLPLKEARDSWNGTCEKHYLKSLLERHGDNVSAAARAAGVTRVHMYRLLWKHGLKENGGA